MTLRERLKCFDGLVKVGTEDGSGFFWGGDAKKLLRTAANVDKANKDKWRYSIQRNEDALVGLSADDDKAFMMAVNRLWKPLDAYKNYTPILDREVVKESESCCNDAYIIIVKGKDSGDIDTVKPFPKLEPIPADAALNLLGAILEDYKKTLVKLFYNIYRYEIPQVIAEDLEWDADKLIPERYKTKINDTVKQMRNCISGYGLHDDPKERADSYGIVKDCQRIAKEQIREDLEKEKEKAKKKKGRPKKK